MALQGGHDDIVETVVNGGSRKKGKVNKDANCSYWSDLPYVLLEVILSQLGIIDFLMFACVCKSWRAVALSLRQKFMSSQGPLAFLMATNATKTVYFYNMFDESLYRTTMPHLRGNKCLGFTCGYLVLVESNMTKPKDTIWLVNPFTRHELEFPRPPRRYSSVVLASLVCSSSPQAQQYVVIAYSKFHPFLQFCRYGDGEWTVSKCDNVDSTIVDVAAFNGKIYVFTSNGRLGFLRLSSRIPTVTLQQLSVKINAKMSERARVNLVAYNQHLFLTIFVHIEVKIYRLDFEKMVWERVRMNSEILFISDKKSSAFAFPKPELPLDPLEVILGRALNRVCYLGKEGQRRYGGHNARYLAGLATHKDIPATRRDGKPNILLSSPLWYFPHLSYMVDPVYEED